MRKYEESDPTNITQTDRLHFFYDAQSRPAKVEYNGEMYTYLHNLQGDITGIVDAGGQTVVQYSYDAWGEPLGAVSTLITEFAVMNLFRYRGYMYDEELHLYYLKSRFFLSGYMRFIAPDFNVGRQKRPLAHNVFTYTANNPTNFTDPSGESLTNEQMARLAAYGFIAYAIIKGSILSTDRGDFKLTRNKPREYLSAPGYQPQIIQQGSVSKEIISPYLWAIKIGQAEISDDSLLVGALSIFTNFADAIIESRITAQFTATVYCEAGEEKAKLSLSFSRKKAVQDLYSNVYRTEYMGPYNVFYFDTDGMLFEDNMGNAYYIADAYSLFGDVLSEMEMKYN